MKILFIGGSGNISTSCSKRLLEAGHDLYLLTRGKRVQEALSEAQVLQADINDKARVQTLVEKHHFDVVANFIAFTPSHIQRDLELFMDRCDQYVFISSASAYQKPPSHPVITESTPLANPFWDYSRDKIACEALLLRAYRDKGFPVTIVRPSHTYDQVIPAAVGSWEDFTLIQRMREGKPIVIHGDGSSLWVMTHSEDFARAFQGLLGNIHAIGHAVHITSDELLTWNQIYALMAKAAGVELRAVYITSERISEEAEKLGMHFMRGNLFGDKSCSVIFDNSKVRSLVPGWVATIPFSEGIRRTIDWFDADDSRRWIDDQNKQLLDVLSS